MDIGELWQPLWSMFFACLRHRKSRRNQLQDLVFGSCSAKQQSGDDDDHIVKFTERSQRLKGSLSETLTSFFPVSGRIKDNVSIDCIDQGVEYFEARVDCLLDNILEDPETDVLRQFVHFDDTSLEASVRCLLLVQINLFKCGGIAIGLSFSHNIVTLMDTSDGEGVHAYVCLSKQDMALFEHDPDLLAFGSPNPGVVVNMVMKTI